MTRYYVAIGSERKGPFALDELRSVPLARDTLVWSQGMDDWAPAEKVPDLLPLLTDSMPPAVQPAAPANVPAAAASAPATAGAASGASTDDFILANPRLPRMAQAICVYVLVVGPAMWLLNNVSCLALRRWDDTTRSAAALFVLEVIYAIVTLVTALLLAIGGLQLRALRAAGVTLLKVGLWTNMVIYFVTFIVGIGIGIATADELAPAETPPNVGDVVQIMLFVATILMMAWEITSLVWLIRARDRLPRT